MKKRILLLLLCFGGGALSLAQTINQSVVASQGETSTTENWTLDWTLGETFVLTVPTVDGLLTEGVHQPIFRIGEVKFPTLFTLPSQVTVSPNPVSQTLFVDIEKEEDNRMRLELYDLNSNLISIQSIGPAANSAQIDMSNLPAGLYLLRVFEKEGSLPRVFKVSKLH